MFSICSGCRFFSKLLCSAKLLETETRIYRRFFDRLKRLTVPSVFKRGYPVKFSKLNICLFQGPFLRLKLATQAGTTVLDFWMNSPCQRWQNWIKMNHFVRALSTCIYIVASYFFHFFPGKYSIEWIYLIAIKFFIPQSFLKNLQLASSEKRVLLSSSSCCGL